MFESIFVLTTYLLIVLNPVLIPAALHLVHAVRDRRQTSRPARTARSPRPAPSPRLAVPAMA